jgi:thymidylate synthase (FAD)
MKISLITWTGNPVKAIASQIFNMNGEMYHDLDNISIERAEKAVLELKNTKLGGALEIVDFLFQIEGVPRAFTHQIVRNRVGCTYHQESLRFTEKIGGFNYEIPASILNNNNTAGTGNDLLVTYEEAMHVISNYYDKLKELGAPTQDARGVLPINICTKIGFKVNLKTLMHMANVRLCYQSQPHWVEVMNIMKSQISEKVSPILSEFLVPYCIANGGKCGYKAIFDRVCPKREERIKKLSKRILRCYTPEEAEKIAKEYI